jgi:cation diffusion facilitator CzcD-associated flavoprotein CzcO
VTPHPIVVVGDGAVGELETAGITDFRLCRDVISSVFDDDTDTWVLSTAADETFRASVVIAAHPPVYVPWTPDIAGHNDFRGESFHAAAPNPDFDPAGKRIAVIGTDAAAAHYLGGLCDSAEWVTAFAHAPRRFVTELPLPRTRATRWLRRHLRGARPSTHQVGSAIDALTASGIRTSDGAEYDVDAIVYGTGFTVPDHVSDTALVGSRGLTIRQAWNAGMEPFCGVAVHGFPNYFFATGPDLATQARYIGECLKFIRSNAGTRIEVRRSSQQVFNERAQLRPVPPPSVGSAFDLSSSAPEDDQTYDGAATLTIAGTDHPVRVRLTGHLDPIDGHYHWQGTVFELLADDAITQARVATLTVGECSAPARIVEKTPWGTHSVAGVGAPPYTRSC